VSTMAILKTGAFRTAVTGTTHAKSRWQIFRDEDAVCVLDIQSATALTSLTVPKLVLDEETPYFWRVQFIDSKGAASAWSDYEDFVTNKTNADLNANGIPDVQEVTSTVDLDRDGVKDNLQKTIKSVKMEGSSVQIGVSIKGSPTALAIESVESESGQPDSYASSKPWKMPFGLINFKIAVAKTGDQAVVKLYFSKAAPFFSKWYKYDPIADKWYDFSTYAKFASDRRSVTLTLTDGGPGDADGVANGVIVDPAGIVEVEKEAVSGGETPQQHTHRRQWRQ
jgi:chitinase